MNAEAAQLTIKSAPYRDYPVELKAAVIAAIEQNGGNVLATSRLFNLPRDTVNYWWANSERFVEIKQQTRLALADKCENIAHSLADSIESHDLSIVPLAQKATTLGIVIDKMQLLRGLPTNISENIERKELTVVLEDALAEAIDVTPVE
jgi:transposase-like protein